jgi:hypothetical protein
MLTVFTFIARVRKCPDSLSYEANFKAIVTEWRPELADCLMAGPRSIHRLRASLGSVNIVCNASR